MLKSVWSWTTCVHAEISLTKDYLVYEQIYMIIVSVEAVFWGALGPYTFQAAPCLRFG